MRDEPVPRLPDRKGMTEVTLPEDEAPEESAAAGTGRLQSVGQNVRTKY